MTIIKSFGRRVLEVLNSEIYNVRSDGFIFEQKTKNQIGKIDEFNSRVTTNNKELANILDSLGFDVLYGISYGA